jgi:hypothetical protein
VPAVMKQSEIILPAVMKQSEIRDITAVKKQSEIKQTDIIVPSLNNPT